MPLQQIALRISGTKQRQAGFAPLVALGVLPGDEGDNMDRSTIVIDKPVYIIKHAPEYALYQLIDRKVKSFDADAPGVLSIALAIPRNNQLADGKSPYTLLKEVYECFRQNFMVPVEDGRDSFLNRDADSALFREIVNRYPLEERRSSYVTMSPAGLTGTLCLPREKMEDFFRDTQYEQFSSFRYIEIGQNCPTSPGLDGLEIPRPIRYEVFVNDQSRHEFLSKPFDSYTATEPNTSLYSYEPIAFTLDELLKAPEHRIVNGKNGKNVVELDFPRNRINCRLGKTEVLHRCEIKVDGSAEEERDIRQKIEEGTFRIKIGDRELTSFDKDGNVWLVPATYSNRDITGPVDPLLQGKRVSLTPKRDPGQRRFDILVSIQPVVSASLPVSGRNDKNKLFPDEAKIKELEKKILQLEDQLEAVNIKRKDDQEDIENQRRTIRVLGLALIFMFLVAAGAGIFALKVNNQLKEKKTEIENLEKDQKEMKGENESLRNQLNAREAAAAAEAERQEAERLEAEKKAEEEAQKKAAEADMAKAHADAQKHILKMVNENKTIEDIRNSAVWKLLTEKEQITVENVAMDPKNKYSSERCTADNRTQLQKDVQKILDSKKPFSTFDDMKKTQSEIGNIEANHQYVKKK